MLLFLSSFTAIGESLCLINLMFCYSLWRWYAEYHWLYICKAGSKRAWKEGDVSGCAICCGVVQEQRTLYQIPSNCCNRLVVVCCFDKKLILIGFYTFTGIKYFALFIYLDVYLIQSQVSESSSMAIISWLSLVLDVRDELQLRSLFLLVLPIKQDPR